MFSAIRRTFEVSSKEVRKIVIDFLKSLRDLFAHIIPEKDWNKYITTMSVIGC